MITTEHMGLVLWDLEKDDFEHSKLADNFVKIDQHNHAGLVSSGKYKNEDTAEGEKTVPTPKSDILNYAEDNADVAKWEAVGQGEGIRTPEDESPTNTAIRPESIWRYLLALRSVGHRQLDTEGVWSENIAEEAVERKHIKLLAVDTPQLEDESVTGPKLEKGLLPLGIVVSWYKSPSEPTPGSKWAVCEGQEWKTVDNELGSGYAKLEAGNVPNLINKFIRGTNAAGIGTTGGKSTLDLHHHHTVNGHTHTINGHSHTVAVDSHTHTIANYKHKHNFKGTNINSRENAFTDGRRFSDFKDNGILIGEGSPTENTLQSLYVGGHTNEELPMSEDTHNHGGTTGATSPGGSTNTVGLTSNSTSPDTNDALETYNIEPPWVGLCQIIKVKR
jgi:hypothetical protein